jgi:RNA polymerase sigma factor (sigma-70 family)
MAPDPNRLSPERLLKEMGWVRGVARGLVSNPGDADDLAQETWVSATQGPPRPEGLTRAWLARVLRNRLLSRSLSDRRRARREFMGARRAETPLPEELVSRMETQRLLAEAVMRLGEPYRSTVILRYSEGLAPAEIARRLAVPASTVRSRLKRALAQLREDLDARFDGGREAWSIALAPWVGQGSLTLMPMGPVGVAGGMIAMNKVLVAAVLAALVGGSWLLWERSATSSMEGAASSSEDQPVSLAETAVEEGPERELPTERRVAADSIPAEGVPVAPEFSSQPGWWLVGQVRGVSADAPGITTVDVRLPRRIGTPHVEGVASATGAVELNLAAIFTYEYALPETLEVVLRREGYLSTTLELEVNRRQRQAGYIAGERGELELDVTLRRAAGTIRGRVLLPPGREPGEISVALVPLVEKDPDREPIDIVSCGPGGSFRLAAEATGLHDVVAFENVTPRVGKVEARLRPASTRVVMGADPGVLDDPLVLSHGEAIEGVARGAPGIAMEVTARLVETGRDCPFGRLCVVGGRYELIQTGVITNDRGQFRIDGLAPAEYDVSGSGFGWKGHGLPHQRTGGGGGAGWDEPIRVSAPTRNLELELGFPAYAFQVLSSGSPLEGASIAVRHESGWSVGWLGELGRYVMSLPLDTRKELLFSKPGYEPRTLVLEPGEPPYPGWRPIELAVAAPAGILELMVVGDPRHTVEQFYIRIHVEGADPDSTQRQLPGFQNWRSLKRRQDSDSLVIDGIPPGRYRVEVKPGQRSADDCYVLPQYLDVDLSEGGTQNHSLVLQEGGRLRILTGPIEDRSMRYLLLDEAGGEVTTEMLVRLPGGGQTRSSGSALHSGSNLTKPLPAGQYTLQVKERGRDSAWKTYQVALGGGRTVELNVGEE